MSFFYNHIKIVEKRDGNMIQKWLGIMAGIFLCLGAFAQSKDTIFIYDGQVLIGSIKNAQMGEITIDADNLQILQIKQYKIKTINSTHRFKIETIRKEVHLGIITSSPKTGWVVIKLDNGDLLEIQMSEINTIISVQKKFFQRLDGNLTAGFSYSKSSDIGQLNFAATTYYTSEKFIYQLSLSTIASIDSSSFSRDREDATISVLYYFKRTWFAAAALSYQRNLELAIARRYQELIGGGTKLLTRQNWQLLAITGLTFNQEKSTSGESESLLLEVPVIVKFDFYKYRKPNLQLSIPQAVYVSLSQKGRIRYDGDMNFSWELAHHFYLTLNPYLNYDSQPPKGSNNFDYGTAIGITFKF